MLPDDSNPPWRRLWAALLLALPAVATSLPAQENNAGFGGVLRTLDATALTGSRRCFGCIDVAGATWISASAPIAGAAHVLVGIDPAGAVTATLSQPAVHSTSAFGMRDLCTDGRHIAGGSEGGVTIVTTAGTLATSWDGHAIGQQPITGQAFQLLDVPRGLCWDGSAGGGAGRFYAVDFGGPIVEFDLQGNVTGTFANAGWPGIGLALDPTTGNLWTCGAGGDVVEIDRSGGSWLPTGNTFPRARPTAYGGGLGEADGGAGIHAPWPSTFCLLSMQQDGTDLLAVHRVHLAPGRPGPEDVRLEIGTNLGPVSPSTAEFGVADILTVRVSDPTSARNGAPAWLILNLPPLAATDDLTDLSFALPGVTALPEHRTHNAASVNVPTNDFHLFLQPVGATGQIPLPPTMPVPAGMLFRLQGLVLEPSLPHAFASTNEAYWVGGAAQSGVTVEATGPSSHATDARRGFWRIRHLGGCAPIRGVSLDWAAGSEPGQQTMTFDIDEDLAGRRFDAGNAQGTGCRGTFRGGSDVATGLDYAHPQNHRAACATGAENAGFTIDAGGPTAARAITFRFAGSQFDAGRSLEFDCDTDGGLGTAGDAMRGLRVRVQLVDGTLLSGTLQRDPLRAATALARL